MKRFNAKAFRDRLDTWVTGLDDLELNRAFEIVLACLEAHARVDRQPKQSKAAAEREAYQDFALAFEGEPATYTMIGMVHELEAMVPESLREDGTFEQVMEEAIAKARGKAVQREAEPAPTPPLQLLQGGKS